MWGRTAKVKPIHDVWSVFNAIQRVAATSGITLVPEDGCEQPRTDLRLKKVYLEPLNAYWPIERINKWRGEAYHEVGHHAPEVIDTLPMMLKNKIDFDSLVGKLINIVDDVRNEFNHYGDWAGRDEALSWAQGFYCQRGAKALQEYGISDEPDIKLTADVMGWVYDYRTNYQPDLKIPSMDFNDLVDGNKYSHLSADLDSMVTADDVYDIVMKILDKSEDHTPEEEMEKAQDGAKERSEEKGEGGEGDNEEGGDEDGEGGDPAKRVSYKDLMGHEHTTGKPKEDAFTKIDYDHEEETYTPWDKMQVAKARDHKASHRSSISSMQRHYKKGRSLASVARRLFQSVTQSMRTHNHKTGRLDKRDLYRIPNGSQDVFTRKSETPDPKGTALFILTDASGSMCGEKYEVTAAAVALLNDAIQPLGIPTEIAAFTENSWSGCRHWIIKTFGENRSSDKIIEDYANISSDLAQNADGESIMWAYNRLRMRPEPRKILLVLSDGEPCCDNYGDCYTYTKSVIKHVGKNVECYGIGILDDSVEDLYPEYAVLKRSGELEKALLDVVKHKIFNL